MLRRSFQIICRKRYQTREVDNLVFKQEINYIREQASQRSYENLEKILDALEKRYAESVKRRADAISFGGYKKEVSDHV